MIEFMESSVAPIDKVSGLSRRKQGFDSPWGYLFYRGLKLQTPMIGILLVNKLVRSLIVTNSSGLAKSNKKSPQ